VPRHRDIKYGVRAFTGEGMLEEPYEYKKPRPQQWAKSGISLCPNHENLAKKLLPTEEWPKRCLLWPHLRVLTFWQNAAKVAPVATPAHQVYDRGEAKVRGSASSRDIATAR